MPYPAKGHPGLEDLQRGTKKANKLLRRPVCQSPGPSSSTSPAIKPGEPITSTGACASRWPQRAKSLRAAPHRNQTTPLKEPLNKQLPIVARAWKARQSVTGIGGRQAVRLVVPLAAISGVHEPCCASSGHITAAGNVIDGGAP
jgi:hypothetical protein